MLSFGEDENTKMVPAFRYIHPSRVLLESLFLLVDIQRNTVINCLFSVLSLRSRFLTDSSGTYTEYKAVSIGAGCEGATDMLKDLYKPVFIRCAFHCRISHCKMALRLLCPH